MFLLSLSLNRSQLVMLALGLLPIGQLLFIAAAKQQQQQQSEKEVKLLNRKLAHVIYYITGRPSPTPQQYIFVLVVLVGIVLLLLLLLLLFDIIIVRCALDEQL
jgi:hypothetical protein